MRGRRRKRRGKGIVLAVRCMHFLVPLCRAGQGRAGQHDYVTWCGVARFVRGYKSVKHSNLQFTSLPSQR